MKACDNCKRDGHTAAECPYPTTGAKRGQRKAKPAPRRVLDIRDGLALCYLDGAEVFSESMPSDNACLGDPALAKRAGVAWDCLRDWLRYGERAELDMARAELAS